MFSEYGLQPTPLGESRRKKAEMKFLVDMAFDLDASVWETKRYKADMQPTSSLPIPGIMPEPIKGRVKPITMGTSRKFK